MEKLLTTEERIRRAEEIYASRRNGNAKNHTTRVNVNEKRNFKLLKKVVIQILVCTVIYYLLVWMQNTTTLLSTEKKEQLKEVLSYDIDFHKVYEKLEAIIPTLENKEQKNQEEPKESQENNPGLEEATLSATETIEENLAESTPVTQMQEDANQVKESYQLTEPIKGQISSGFGQRESNNPIVSSNHLGIDIAAQEGTKIKAAIEGEVTIARESKTYR